MVTYDPAMAQGNLTHAQGARRNNAQGNENQENVGRERQAGQSNDNGGQNFAPHARRGTHSAGGGNPMPNNAPAQPERRQQSAGKAAQQPADPNTNKYNDGYSAMVNDGYELSDRAYQAMGAKLGGRNLQPDDARLKLD